MEKRPLVSVLTTAYNREKYISQVIDSVLCSTYDNFELIIVDDVSSDRTYEIARSYEKRDSRVRVYVNEKNLGDYPNRNKAASLAGGKYLKYVDADDYIYPWGLDLLVRMMEEFPEAGWGLCSLPQDKNRPFPFVLTPQETYRYEFFGPGLFHKAPLSSIVKKNVFNEAGGFGSARMVGDYDMWARLASRYPVVLMPRGIVWYREHGSQEMSHYLEFAGAYESIIVKSLTSGSCPLNVAEKKRALAGRRKKLFRGLMKSFLTLQPKQMNAGVRRLYEHYKIR